MSFRAKREILPLSECLPKTRFLASLEMTLQLGLLAKDYQSDRNALVYKTRSAALLKLLEVIAKL
jgi:hypothetical protein